MEPQHEPSPAPGFQRLRDAADQVLVHFSDPKGKNLADVAHALDKVLGPWMDRYFMRKGRGRISQSEAEELTQDVWIKLLAGKHVARSNAFALVCKTAHSVFASHIGHKEALKNKANGERDGPSAEVATEDDPDDDLLNPQMVHVDNHERRDCLQKMWAVFVAKHASRAELIEYRWEGLSYSEIAILMFGEVAEKERASYEARVRNRIEEARKLAKPLFEQCRD